MSDYYTVQRALGEAYERYIVARLHREGIPIVRHETQAAQFAHGDVRIGADHVEIKLDQQFAVTTNLYIETAEKRRREQATWTPSGIFSRSTARWYGIGDYRDWFLFEREHLRQNARAERLLTIARGTSQGYLMRSSERLTLAVRVRHWAEVQPDGSAAPAREQLHVSEIRWSL